MFTCSFHAANNFPTRKEQSALDVPLPDGMQDDDYLQCAFCCCCSLYEVVPLSLQSALAHEP